MSNKRFEMHEIRQVLVQMRLGATDRAIAQSGLMGRNKLAQVRKLGTAQGLLNNKTPLPDDSVLAGIFGKPRQRPAVESSVLPWKDLILQWHRDKVPGTRSPRQRQHRGEAFSGPILSGRPQTRDHPPWRILSHDP